MKPTVTIDDAAFRKDLRSLRGKATGDAMKPAALAGGFVIEGAAKINVRNKLDKHPTGNLLGSINTKPTAVKKNSVTVATGTNVIYAAIHEFGGTIKAKNAKALVFEIDGEIKMVKSVYIPPRPYMRPAVDDNHGSIRDTIMHHLKKLIKP